MRINSAVFDISAPTLAACPESELPEFAFIGRSNVGKSSMLNMLTGKPDLAKVSSTPGHTKLINFFTMNKTWRMVDLPGYGYAKVAKEDRRRFNESVAEYLAGRTNLRCIFVLIDSRLTPQQIDLEFISWLEELSLPYVLVFTKADKLKSKEVEQNMEKFKIALFEVCQKQPRAFVTSSKTRTGQQDILHFVADQLKQKQA